MRKSVIIMTLGLGAVLVLGWLLRREQPVLVQLTLVEKGIVEATVANTRAGTIKACQRSRLSMPVGGQVADLLVAEGDRVSAGQLLLSLWNEDQRARVDEAGARLRSARQASNEHCDTAALNARELQRQRGLAAKKLISEDRLDAAETQARVSAHACERGRASVDTAAAALSLQQALLKKTQLHAPFAGVIAEINGEVGEYITPSPPGVATPPAVDLIGTDCLYVSAPIDEVDAAAIAVGMPVRITLDAFRGRGFDGRVTRIAPYVLEREKQARTVDVEVAFDTLPADLRLLIGYSADLEVILERRDQVLRVPSEAIIEGRRVLLYDPRSNRLQSRDFEPGLSNWTYTEAIEGLQEGDRLLLSLDTPGAVAGALVETVDGDSERGGD